MLKNLKNIVFFIGARGNSKCLKNKNLKKINNRTLISWTILQLKKSKFYSTLIVSSDYNMILKESKKNGADFLIKRPKKLSLDSTGKFSVWKHAIDLYEKKTKTKIDILVDLDCTNPLRFVEDIDKIIETKINNKKTDAVVTISNSRKNPYFNMLEYKKNYLTISKKIKKWPATRQDTPNVYDQVASIYCMERNFIKKSKYLYQGKIKGYLVKNNQSFDIDNKLDFDLVKFIFKKYKFYKKIL